MCSFGPNMIMIQYMAENLHVMQQILSSQLGSLEQDFGGCLKNHDVHNQMPVLFNEKSDIFSFAMTCYEILTSHIPFEFRNHNYYDGVLFWRTTSITKTY